MSSIDDSRLFVPLGIAVLTISDTRSLADDKSGTLLAERIVAAGHVLAAHEIIVDDVDAATFIFCLPGSPGACRDGWDGILAAQLDYRTRPCNFVEIMPRLDEHLRRPKAQGATA